MEVSVRLSAKTGRANFSSEGIEVSVSVPLNDTASAKEVRAAVAVCQYEAKRAILLEQTIVGDYTIDQVPLLLEKFKEVRDVSLAQIGGSFSDDTPIRTLLSRHT